MERLKELIYSDAGTSIGMAIFAIAVSAIVWSMFGG